MVLIFRCKTKKNVISLMKKLHEKGYVWNDTASLLDLKLIDEYWKLYKKELLIGIRKNKRIGYGTIKDLERKELKEYLKDVYDYDEKNVEKLIMVESLRGKEK